MVRTQIQLQEAQVASLKKLARQCHVSVAELIRRGVDLVLATEAQGDSNRRKQRAKAVAGRFASGCTDISTNHDRYLAEDAS